MPESLELENGYIYIKIIGINIIVNIRIFVEN